MADAVMPQELFVLLDGRVAGTLQRGKAPGSHTFAYDDGWRNDPAAFPLSLSLPLASGTYEGPHVSYYLRALLPDSEARLNAIAFQYRVDPDDSFALLSHVGEDCPGAVQFARTDRLAAVMGEGPRTIEWLTDHEVADILRELQSGDP